MEISWYGPHCDGVAESVSVAVPWSVVVTPPMLEKSLLVALWLSVSVPYSVWLPPSVMVSQSVPPPELIDP